MKKNIFVISVIIVAGIIVGVITGLCVFSGNKPENVLEEDSIEIVDRADYEDDGICDSLCIDIQEECAESPIIDDVDELEIPANKPDNEKY